MQDRRLPANVGTLRTMDELSNSAKPSRAAGQVKIDLGPALKADWAQWCSERGLVPGRAVRTLVERAIREGLELGAGAGGRTIALKVRPVPDEGPKVQREVHFTPSEDRAISSAAAGAGLGYFEWVVAAVRAALTSAPTYGQAELEAVTASNRMLANVLLELSAMRRAGAAGLDAERLAVLEREVRRHVETVSAAMAQGARRWQIDV